MPISPLEELIRRHFVLCLKSFCSFLRRWRQVFQHNDPPFFQLKSFGNCSWLDNLFYFTLCLRYVVRIVLYCSGVISYKFVVLSAKISRFSDNLMLFMLSTSFFWKPLLTGLNLIDGIISYRSIWNSYNSSCCGGVKFDLKPKFVLLTGRSFLLKNVLSILILWLSFQLSPS